MSATKRSISAPSSLFEQADTRKTALGYASFSDYIQALMRTDVLGGGDHLRETFSPDAIRPPNPPSAEAINAHVEKVFKPVTYGSRAKKTLSQKSHSCGTTPTK